MSEKEKTMEIIEPTFGFGSVVLRKNKDNRRGIIVQLPVDGDDSHSVEVASIESEDLGAEVIGAMGGHTLSTLVLLDEEAWSPEKVASAIARRYGTVREELLTEIIADFEDEAQKPPVRWSS